jgi:hypothetical protein
LDLKFLHEFAAYLRNFKSAADFDGFAGRDSVATG